MLVYTASPKCYCNICHRVEALGTDQDSPSWWVLRSPAFHLLSFSPPEVGLFGADVGTDLVNGHNLIKTGDPIWGTLMISLPFLPALILGILLVLMALGQKNWCTLCFVLLFFVPLVALATPLYILLVLIIGLSRVVSPEFSWTFFGFDLTTSLNSMLRMLEVTGESSSEQLERQSSHQWPTTLGTPTTAPWWRGPSPSSPASCSSPSAWSDYCRLSKDQPMDSVTLTSDCHQVPFRTSLIFKTELQKITSAALFRSAITIQVEIFHDVCNFLEGWSWTFCSSYSLLCSPV